MDRVVITGVGVVSPIGLDRETFWQGCLDGTSGAVRLETDWVRQLSTQISCPVRGFEPRDAGVPPRMINNMDRTTRFAIAATQQAVDDAGFTVAPAERRDQLKLDGVDADRMATVVGTGIAGISTIELSHGIWREQRSKDKIKRYSLPMLIPNAAAGNVAIRFGARGECKAVCTACASSTMALGDSLRLIAAGEADVVLAGGTEGFAEDVDAYGLMGFDRLRTMSERNDDPQRASRPFDRERDGFVLGEGSAMLVLEREQHARARGARPYAAISGYACNCDAGTMMQLDDTGERIVRLATAALDRAGLSAQDVDHVSAHGTSTQLNDRTESLALARLLGSRLHDVPVTALKSMTGHAIGASGALETAALCLSFRHGVLTPTINYEFPDPECDVNLVANQSRQMQPTVALNLSYGFGGHNACLVLTAP